MSMVTAFVLGLIGLATTGARDLPLDNTPMGVEEWTRLLQSETLGCSAEVADPYEWRVAGFGSNMNFLLLAWANAILYGRGDLAVILNTQMLFPQTRCVIISNGQETRSGWPCVFAPMPRLCAFDSNQDWTEFNEMRAMLPSEQRKAFGRGGVNFLRGQLPFIEHSLHGSGMDTLGFLAMLYEHLNSHLQPWFKADVEAVLAEPAIAAVRAGKYVSMHIRRTDKDVEVPYTETKEYFTRVLNYLTTSPSGLNATEISGLWLSTDDDAVFDEVKSLTPQYFPGVKPEAVIFVTNRVPVRVLRPERRVNGAADRNYSYMALVLLRVELLMLASAEVFSGTFSSNMGRIVALMRETLSWPRDSALSSDAADWFPG